MLKLHDIIRAHVELSTRCNARCPMCMRNYRGSDYNGGYPLIELSLQDFQHIFQDKLLAQLRPPPMPNDGFKHRQHQFYGVMFNGNLGDFAMAHDALPIVEYLVDHQISVRINTNGSLRTPDWWAKFALPGVEVGFDIDGLEDTHHLYRQDTNWQRIINNARALIAAGGHATWRFIPFDHNRHQEQQCREMSIDLGFKQFENIYDGRDRGPTFHRDGSFSHWIGIRGPTESAEPPDIKPMLQNHITWFDHRTVRSEKDTLVLDMQCQHKIQKEIYIAADGSVYPCCFLGFYPKTMHHPGNQQLKELVRENNALEYDLEHCMNWFGSVEETWQRDNVAAGRLYTCVNTCNRASKND